jgi:hypothetical protein
MTFVDGILVGLLFAALVGNLLQHLWDRSTIDAWRTRALAAETRSAEQIDAMLARLSTAPRLEMRAGEDPAPVDPDERVFISDLPTDDEVWNDFVGEDPDEDLS